jgi:transcriptional regulator with XRE-family HTH domain
MIKDRIKLVRKKAGLTQEQFAKKIGTVQNTITGYETGRRNPSGSAITLICKEFNINENWLRYGQGDMYNYSGEDDEIQAALKDITNDPIARQIVLNFWHMNESEKKQFWSFLKNLIPEDKER